MEHAAKIDPAVIKQCFELGLMAIETPEEYGGAGSSFFNAIVAIEELARVDASVSVFVDVHNTLCTNAFLRWGTEEQKWDFVGAAWAIRAWGWLELTNQYGDAILKDAFHQDQSQFHYDTQPEFYDSCRTICFRALSFLNRTDGNLGQHFAEADAYFNKGDM